MSQHAHVQSPFNLVGGSIDVTRSDDHSRTVSLAVSPLLAARSPKQPVNSQPTLPDSDDTQSDTPQVQTINARVSSNTQSDESDAPSNTRRATKKKQHDSDQSDYQDDRPSHTASASKRQSSNAYSESDEPSGNDSESFASEQGSESDYSAPRKRNTQSRKRKDNNDFGQFHQYAHAVEPGSSEDEFYATKRAKESSKARKRVVESESEDLEAMRFSSRGKAVTNYDDSAQIEDALLMMSDEEYYELPVVEEEGDVIETIFDYRIATIMNDDNEDDEMTEYLIKWKGKSHLYNTWESADSLQGIKGLKKLDNYRNRLSEQMIYRSDLNNTKEEIENMDIQREIGREELKDYLIVERVIAQRVSDHDEETGVSSGVEYLCKWTRLPYTEVTWEHSDVISVDFQPEIDAFLDRTQSLLLPHKNSAFIKSRQAFKPFSSQPAYFVGGTLRDYQLKGVNWMAYLWHRNENGILADEMGLGKTVQSISFLNYLFHSQQVYGPYLVIVPLSTIGAWQAHFAKWAPSMNVVVYTGDGKSRDIIRTHEFYCQDNKIKFNALLTTYELILKDKAHLGRIKWAFLAMDEAHRLKNASSQLYEALQDFHTTNRLLITGTPLQNSVKELVALVHFLMPDKFREFEGWEIDVDGEGQGEKIRELQEKLKPHMLRRLKKDVEKDLPAKTERILRVELAPLQLEYYKKIYTKNFVALKANGNLSGQLSLMNICMELKKASNHPYLFIGAEEMGMSKENQLRGLILNSGKMVLLDKLLSRLRDGGHRVLIFSQSVRMLDILHDYMVLRGYPHQRLDGSVGGEQRKRSMDHFNKFDSPDFAFLLSTRAGGLGLNLETADTVIIFDSDWNPQNDLQAMARAHRIGQKKVVNVYHTIEEEIIERAKRKMVLEYCIIKQMDTTGESLLGKSKIAVPSANMTKEELQTILKFGAQNLFQKHVESNSESQTKLETLDLDDLLARAEHTNAPIDDGSTADGGAEFLEQWKVQDFGVGQMDWDEIIPERERLARAAATSLDRHATQSNALTDTPKKKKAAVKRKKTGTSVEMSEQDIRALVKSMQKFGHVEERQAEICEDAQLDDKDPDILITHANDIILACNATLTAKEETPTPVEPSEKPVKALSTTYHAVTLNPLSFTTRISELSALNYRMAEQRSTKGGILAFRIASKTPHKPVTNWTCTWGHKDDAMLLVGINTYGVGNWDQMQADPDLGFRTKFFLGKSEADGDAGEESNKLLPKASHLLRRGEYLLRVLKDDEDAKGPRKVKTVVKPKTKRVAKPKSSFKHDSDDPSPLVTNSNFANDTDFLNEPKPKSRRKSTAKPVADPETAKVPPRKAPARKAEKKAAAPKSTTKIDEPLPKKKKQRRAKVEADISSYESMDDRECKRLLMPLKAEMRQMRDGTADMNATDKADFLKRTITSIGELIITAVGKEKQDKAEQLSKHLWKFSSCFWPAKLSSGLIKAMYEKVAADSVPAETVKTEQSNGRSEMRREDRKRSRSRSRSRDRDADRYQRDPRRYDDDRRDARGRDERDKHSHRDRSPRRHDRNGRD